MSKVIVTGGSGFLGKHLCRTLTQAGHQVKNIDVRPNAEVETVIADIRDQAQMLEHVKDAEFVFHLAALIEAGESVKFPQKFIDTNISGTVTVLEAMRQNGIFNFAFSSSAAVYGEPQRKPIKEDDRTLPINPYGMTKLAIEGLVASYVASYNMTGVGLRYFNLYGPEELHEPETHAIPRFMSQIERGEEVTIWGSGEHLRDFIYITDVVDAHIKCMELMNNQPNKYHYLNLSTNAPTAVRDVVSMLEELMGKEANIKNFPPRPGDPLVLTADASKANEVMGWQAQVDLRTGLRNTLEYFRTQVWK
jgi:UDP-glucose 4-epimerase